MVEPSAGAVAFEFSGAKPKYHANEFFLFDVFTKRPVLRALN